MCTVWHTRIVSSDGAVDRCISPPPILDSSGIYYQTITTSTSQGKWPRGGICPFNGVATNLLLFLLVVVVVVVVVVVMLLLSL